MDWKLERIRMQKGTGQQSMDGAQRSLSYLSDNTPGLYANTLEAKVIRVLHTMSITKPNWTKSWPLMATELPCWSFILMLTLLYLMK